MKRSFLAPLWPPLESLNRLYVARGLPRLADVYGIVEPLMAEYTANLTTRFDDELEAAWQRERWEAMEAPRVVPREVPVQLLPQWRLDRRALL